MGHMAKAPPRLTQIFWMVRSHPVATTLSDSLAWLRAPICVRGFVVPHVVARHATSQRVAAMAVKTARSTTPAHLSLGLTAAQIARRVRRKLASAITVPPLHTAYACALRLTLLSSQEVAARSAYARAKPG